MKVQARNVYGKPITVSVCCAELAKAFEPGTDNEGYGALVSISIHGGYKIGCGELEDIEFCPWCGRRVKQPSNAL